VAVLLGMAVVPAVLVLLVGSELIRTSVDRWFNQPMDVMLTSANAIAGDYYAQQQSLVSAQAQRFARTLGPINLAASPSDVRDLVTPDVLQERIELVEVYRRSARQPLRGSRPRPAGRPPGTHRSRRGLPAHDRGWPSAGHASRGRRLAIA